MAPDLYSETLLKLANLWRAQSCLGQDGVLQLLEPLIECGPKSDLALQSHVLILKLGVEVVSREVIRMIDLVRGRRTVLRSAHPYRLAKLLGTKDDVDVGCPGQVVLAM